MGSAIKAVAVSPLIAAKTVAFGSRFGGWILRGRPGVTLPALRVAIRLPGARSGQRVRQLPELLEASVRGHPAMRRCNLCLNSRIADLPATLFNPRSGLCLGRPSAFALAIYPLITASHAALSPTTNEERGSAGCLDKRCADEHPWRRSA